MPISRKLAYWVLAAFLTVSLTACGGGSGSSSAPAPPVAEDPTPPGDGDPIPPEDDQDEEENLAPTASVLFPLSGSQTTGNVIDVRGTASDPETDRIDSVTVNGVAANTDDGFATWRVDDLALLDGANTLEVVVQDEKGSTGASSIKLEKTENPGPALHSPQGLAFDNTSGEPRLLVMDQTLEALFALDLSEGPTLGHRSVIAENGDGKGIDFVVPGQVVVDAAANRALVLDRGSSFDTGKLIAVDLATRARTESTGFSSAQSLALDAVNNRALIGDAGHTDRLLALDLANPAAGTSPIVGFKFPSSIDLDPANPDRALVVEGLFGIQALFDVNLENETKRKVAATFAAPTVARFADQERFFSVNLNNGSTTLLSGPRRRRRPNRQRATLPRY